MADLDAVALAAFLQLAADPENSTYVRGRAYEDAVTHVFAAVPGCQTQRNCLNRFESEEIDIAVLNFRPDDGLRVFPEIFLVECKNWSRPVDSSTVSEFAAKIRHRSCDLGVLVAASGITGDPHRNTAAYQAASNALLEGQRIILLTTEDLHRLVSLQDIVDLLHRRLMMLIAAGTSVVG